MAEIIQFKGKTKGAAPEIQDPPIDQEVEIITDAVLSACLDVLARVGYDLESDFHKIIPSVILVKESITSLQMKIKGKEHFLQQYAENVFIPLDDDDDENL